jgi:hypothetical protein
MTMKLIMESWRQHINEIGMSDVGIGSYRTDFDPDFRKAEAAAAIKAVKELALFFEPTGQIADVDTDTGKITTTYEVASKSAQSAADAFGKGDYALAGTNSAIAVLAILAMIPLLGKSAKFASKVPIFARKSILNANKVVATLKKSKNSSLLKRADEIEDAIVRTRTWRLKQPKSKPLEITKKLRRDVLSTRKYIGSLPVGSTVTLKQDVYLFIQAKEGKFADGFVKPSMGMGSQDAEKVLEKIRKVSFPDAVPRQNSVYLTPFSDAKRWDHYGPDTYVVKVPKGSKISKMDADWATEVAHDLRSQYSDEVERAVETAAEYWKGAAQSWNYGASTEIITRAKVEVIGKVKDLNLGFSKFRTKTPINDPKWPIISTKRYQGQN